MIRYAVNYIKNMFVPVDVPENTVLADGQYILVRTEKGEEALKVRIVNSEISKLWDKAETKPEPFTFLRVMTKQDLELLEEMKAYDENSSFLRSLRHFEFDHVLLPKFSCFHCLGIEHKLKEYLPDEVQQEKIWELKDEKLFRMIYELLEEIEIFKKKVFMLS